MICSYIVGVYLFGLWCPPGLGVGTSHPLNCLCLCCMGRARLLCVCNVSRITMMMRSRNTVELRSQISVPRQTKTTYVLIMYSIYVLFFSRADILHVLSILQHKITTLLLLFSGSCFVSISFHVGLLFQTNQRCMSWFHLHLILYDALRAQLCNWDF